MKIYYKARQLVSSLEHEKRTQNAEAETTEYEFKVWLEALAHRQISVPYFGDQHLTRRQRDELEASSFDGHLQTVHAVDGYFSEQDDAVYDVVRVQIEDVEHADGQVFEFTI